VEEGFGYDLVGRDEGKRKRGEVWVFGGQAGIESSKVGKGIMCALRGVGALAKIPKVSPFSPVFKRLVTPCRVRARDGFPHTSLL